MGFMATVVFRSSFSRMIQFHWGREGVFLSELFIFPSSSAVSQRGAVSSPRGRLAVSGDIFVTVGVGRWSWHPGGRGQGCCSTPCRAENAPQQGRIPPQHQRRSSRETGSSAAPFPGIIKSPCGCVPFLSGPPGFLHPPVVLSRRALSIFLLIPSETLKVGSYPHPP